MINNDSRKEILLPPAELLEKYERVSPGSSKEIIKLVQQEQEHRHSLQKKYLFHYRLGQFFGLGYGIYLMYLIFDLFKAGQTNAAYILTAMFGFLIVLILQQYREDRTAAAKRNEQRNNYNNNRSYDNRSGDRKRSYDNNRPRRNDSDNRRR